MAAVGSGVAVADNGTRLLVTVAARSCPSYTDITGNLARNDIQESLRDPGPNMPYVSGEPLADRRAVGLMIGLFDGIDRDRWSGQGDVGLAVVRQPAVLDERRDPTVDSDARHQRPLPGNVWVRCAALRDRQPQRRQRRGSRLPERLAPWVLLRLLRHPAAEQRHADHPQGGA